MAIQNKCYIFWLVLAARPSSVTEQDEGFGFAKTITHHNSY